MTTQESSDLPGSVGEVLHALDGILADCARERNPLGYFAALYREVTESVAEGIRQGQVFQDGARMERLDVEFANRYLSAWQAWRQGQPTSRCWRLAFETGARPHLLILQQLLLGMNAHINYDLAIAAATTCPGPQIHGLQKDFMAINQILAELLDEVKGKLASLSPWLGMVDRLGGRNDDALVNFSMARARDMAWSQAVKLAEQEGPWDVELSALDLATVVVGRLVSHPPGLLLRSGLWLAKRREEGDPVRVIMALRA